jgi:DNA-3-methyladenine glycosylase
MASELLIADPEQFFADGTDAVARKLIGVFLRVNSDVGVASGWIVETEAYDEDDPASHTEYKVRKMNKSMFLSGGHIYVYPKSEQCCLNFVCGRKCYGSAVLIRALKPFDASKPLMRERRKKQRLAVLQNDRLLCNGPMNVCQALGIDGRTGIDGTALRGSPIELYEPTERPEVWCGPRVGVKDSLTRRYVWADSEYISHHGEKRYPLSPYVRAND